MDEKELKTYELALLLKTEDDVPAVLSFLNQHHATLEGEFRAKKLALAYPVKKHTEAIFGNARFSALPENAKLIEKEITLRPEVLRSMIIVSKPGKEQVRNVGESFARPRVRTLTNPGTAPAPRQVSAGSTLSNEALEKKIEEILK